MIYLENSDSTDKQNLSNSRDWKHENTNSIDLFSVSAIESVNVLEKKDTISEVEKKTIYNKTS